MTTTPDAARPRAGRRNARQPSFPFITRELSWLDFNERVLYQAEDERNPLLERVRFLTIFASNLDEFFQVRVSGLMQQVAAGHSKPTLDGLSASQKLDRIRGRVLQLQAEHSDTWDTVREELISEGIRIIPPQEWARTNELRERFIDEIFPVLTPLAVDPSHPFPYISDLSLSLAVTVRDPATGERRFARVKVPPVLPRLWEVAPRTYILLERIIAANIEVLFPGMEVESHYLFRVTRNADLDIEEDEADDLLLAMEEELRRRRFGAVVRLEVERSMPHETRSLLQRGLGLDTSNVYEIRGMLDLRGLGTIADLDIPELQRQPWKPVTPPRLLPREEEEDGGVDVFGRIREGDILVHHPYESFANSVQRLVTQAANDPDVLTIKMTLYRTSGDSPIVHALIRAAESGKQVVVLVEIKARFDERANIVWAKALERAGAHVAYGLLGLKTHSKIALIIRRESGGLRRYAHIGTGNYHHKTANLYTDLGLLTADRVLTGDVTDLFNVLTGVAKKDAYRELLVAPKSMRPGIIELIDREVERHREHGDGRIIIKCNAFVDPEMIEKMYEASRVGVPIDLIVRGMCSLQPGVPGFSESIHVRSIVGRYLEHSRIFCFGQGDRERYYIGSADLMERNLNRRVEAMAPVKDPALAQRLGEMLAIMRRDDRRAWTLGADGEWTRVETAIEGEPATDTFEVLMAEAAESVAS
ncbi:MAG: polyphosphate kinase 1 [Candidatus Limnocylindrales bacterium]